MTTRWHCTHHLAYGVFTRYLKLMKWFLGKTGWKDKLLWNSEWRRVVEKNLEL